jgi:two-component system, sensor histidine kinase YesM
MVYLLKIMLFNTINKFSERLVNKLIFLFAFIIITIVLSLTFISYKIIQNDTVKNLIANDLNNLVLVNKNFEKYFIDIGKYSFPLTNYDNFMNAVVNESGDYTQSIYLENCLKNLISQRKDINSVFLYLPKEKKYYFVEYNNFDLTVKIFYNQDFSKFAWYRKLNSSTTNTYIQPLVTDKENGYSISGRNLFIMYHRILRNISNREPLAVISLCINSVGKNEILNDIPIKHGDHTLLLDEGNRIFYTNIPSYGHILRGRSFQELLNNKVNQGNFDFEINHGQFLVVYSITSIDGWKLIKFIPHSQINKLARVNSDISLMIGVAFLILSIGFVMITSNSITKPLQRLSTKMRALGRGDFDAQAEIKGKDEVAQLSRQFNEMVVKINELVNEQYKMKLIQKNAILKALEAELNPHFLYNALQAISTKALKSGVKEIVTMVDALSMTLRFCINGAEIVKVREEINHVKNYLIIQKARYGDKLVVTFELENSVMDFEIPKLSIQSLVENSIKHALEERTSVSFILIRVVSDGVNAKIIIKDNGPGIEKNRLKEIMASLEDEWSDGEYQNKGLKNLNTRLKLLFGQRVQMDIKSDENGTETSITIPGGRLNV